MSATATTTIRRVYRFRLEPTASQEEGFKRYAGARRFVWNWALAQKQAHYKATGTGLAEKELSARLTALKAEPGTAWLREMDSQLLQQALADLTRAFSAFLARRARYPRFKSRKTDAARFRIPQRVALVDGWLTVPKIGRVKVRQSQPIGDATKSATFKRDACGHWLVSLVAESLMPAVAPPLASIAPPNGSCGGRSAPSRAPGKAATIRQRPGKRWRASIRRSRPGVVTSATS